METIQKLKHKWALWETYVQNPSANKGHGGYMENMNRIGEFDTLQDFALLWNNLPHSTPSVFFLEHGTREFKKLQINEGQTKQVESVAIFKAGIMPAWEDQKNAVGGEYHIKMMDPHPPEIDNFWKCLVFDLIGGDLGLEDKINGIRIVDKSRPPRNSTRVEIWVDSRDSELKTKLEEVLAKKYVQDQTLGDKLNSRLEWRDH